jgi:hypothetical protein
MVVFLLKESCLFLIPPRSKAKVDTDTMGGISIRNRTCHSPNLTSLSFVASSSSFLLVPDPSHLYLHPPSSSLPFILILSPTLYLPLPFTTPYTSTFYPTLHPDLSLLHLIRLLLSPPPILLPLNRPFSLLPLPLILLLPTLPLSPSFLPYPSSSSFLL